ncbi:uncharacterized protein LOC131800390 [Musca domestica]|uniref:Uncharacterized protein LOC101900701 isoform X2 n=1 Tax=Musca domestica TaxID=7370 RepID=A0A1I8MY08_MUSDO|nr:uncharacterized protein LOC131800390 [Musca domestica]
MSEQGEKISATETKTDKLTEIRMPAKFEAMINTAFTVDCKFIVGENLGPAQAIFGHKLMFTLNSEVFESMLCGHFLEAKSTEIPLPDDDPKTFRNLRRILYNLRDSQTEVNELDLSDTISLYKMCDKYMFKAISKLCAEHLKSFLETDDDNQLVIIFAAAMELHNSPLLEDVKTKLSAIQYGLLPSLKDLNPLQFMEYLELYTKQNEKSVHHLDIFKAIENYLTANDLIPQELLDTGERLQNAATTNLYGQEAMVSLSQERSLELLQKLLSHIDFVKIKIEDYLTGPGVSKILTWQQKYIILSQICIEPKPSTIKLFLN